MNKELSSLYWLWIPLVFFVLQVLFELLGSANTLSWLIGENGPIEILQALIMIAGFFCALYFTFSKVVQDSFLKFWFGLAALCCLYVAGEEISWGQHIMEWSTPEEWSKINDQQETNLHNTSSWLDQKPRIILLIGITFGALIYPQLKKLGLIKLPEKLDFIFPSKKLGIIALLILIPKILEKSFEAFDIFLFARFSEVEELYMFYFIFLYLIMLYRKTKESEKY